MSTQPWTPAPVPPSPTLRDRAYETIKRGILRLEIPPGTPLVEASLADRLGVSKSPVREALHLLEREGLAVRESPKGVQVAALSRRETLQAFEVRAVLEELAVRLTAERVSPGEVGAVRALIDEGDAAVARGDAEATEAAIDDFHRAVARAAGNELLAGLLDQVYDRLARVRALAARRGTRGEASMAEHRAILDAIAAGDADTAVARCRAHADRLLREVHGLLDEALGSSEVSA